MKYFGLIYRKEFKMAMPENLANNLPFQEENKPVVLQVELGQPVFPFQGMDRRNFSEEEIDDYIKGWQSSLTYDQTGLLIGAEVPFSFERFNGLFRVEAHPRISQTPTEVIRTPLGPVTSQLVVDNNIIKIIETPVNFVIVFPLEFPSWLDDQPSELMDGLYQEYQELAKYVVKVDYGGENSPADASYYKLTGENMGSGGDLYREVSFGWGEMHIRNHSLEIFMVKNKHCYCRMIRKNYLK